MAYGYQKEKQMEKAAETLKKDGEGSGRTEKIDLGKQMW